MHEIVIKETEGVYVEFIDLLTTHTPFYHVDRIAKSKQLTDEIKQEVALSSEKMRQLLKAMEDISESSDKIYAVFYKGREQTIGICSCSISGCNNGYRSISERK